MENDFGQWASDLLARFTKEFEEGAHAQMERLLREGPAGLLGKSMEALLKGLDVEALGRMMAGGPPRQGSPYQVLGLDPSATDAEVKQRYRDLVRRLHPDAAGPGGEFLFKLVSEAYQRILRERGL